ncbi:MAG: hypothetical protein WCK26_03130 [Candidatus Saccharibacteria bacterium]
MSKKFIPLFLLVAVFLSSAFILNASAENSNMSDQQVQTILSNCSSTKNTLNQLHASDALLRVNMGQIYESISTKMMNGFNERVSNNKFNNSDLVNTTNDYNLTLNTFRSDYKVYEEHLSSAIKIDCSKQPVAFYDAVSLARSERDRVHADIAKLNQYLDQYKSAIEKFEKDFQSNNGEGKN